MDNILYTACITPLNNARRIDWKSFEQNLRDQEKAGNGALVLGSTGEALGLTLEERKEVVDFAVSLKLGIPLMIGVGGTDIDAQVKWIRFLNTRNIDCYLTVTPMYSKPGIWGQTQWFKTLLDAAAKPCMLYNVPGRTGGELHRKTVLNLLGHKNLWAIKEASGSVEKFKGYVALSSTLNVYCGDDGLMPEFSAHGAKGLVSVAGNTWPEATRTYSQKCLQGELSPEEITLWKKAADSLFVASNPVPAKALMKRQNRIATDLTRSPLSERDLLSDAPLINAEQAINNWKK